MKTLILLLISTMLLVSFLSPKNRTVKVPVATCYGRNPCVACKTCNYCKLCNSGGTCGICSSSKGKATLQTLSVKPKPTTSSSTQKYSGQCKATTQKGTRCKRSAGSNGYCWQHG